MIQQINESEKNRIRNLHNEHFILNEQARNIVLNTMPNTKYKYYYTYKIGGKSYKSDESTLDSSMSSTNTNNDELIDQLGEAKHELFNLEAFSSCGSQSQSGAA